MTDRYTKALLTIIALNLTFLTAQNLMSKAIPQAWAQDTVNVRVVGGTLDYETDLKSGPTLEVKVK